MLELMIAVAIRLYELKIGSLILGEEEHMQTLPKAPLFCEFGMLAFWLPTFWEILGKCPNVIPKNMKINFYRTRIGRNEQRMHCSG